MNWRRSKKYILTAESTTVLLVFVFVSGCTNQQSIPDDFEIKYGWGSCHADWQWSSINIDSDGNAALEVTRGFFRKEEQFSFSNDELLTIYQKIVKNNFFSLDEGYNNPEIMDGSCSNLWVRANEKEKKVSIANMKIGRFDRITKGILDVFNSKSSNWQELDEKKMCNEARSLCEVQDSHQKIPCDDWMNVCEGIV